jgi:group I intron endonuclease
MHRIYLTTCVPTGKKYVGRCSCDKRWAEGYLGSGVLLKKSIVKYGREQFAREVLEELPNATLREAIDAEKVWLLRLNAKASPDYYNLSENTGGMGKGDKHTEATKLKIKEKMKEVYGETGLPLEWRENVANARKGQIPWNKGKTKNDYPPETYEKRRKMRAPFTDNEVVQILSEYAGGTPFCKIAMKWDASDKTIQRIVRKGTQKRGPRGPMSQEQKDKISLSLKSRRK